MNQCLNTELMSMSHLSFLGLVLAVLGEEVREDVAAAAGHVDQGALLPQAEARRHGQHQSDGLDHQGPLAQVAPDDESTQDGLDLEKRTASRRVKLKLSCIIFIL